MNYVVFFEVLDMGLYMSGNRGFIFVYNFYVVVVYVSVLNVVYNGYYFCLVKNFNGYWYWVDDVKVFSYVLVFCILWMYCEWGVVGEVILLLCFVYLCKFKKFCYFFSCWNVVNIRKCW